MARWPAARRGRQMTDESRSVLRRGGIGCSARLSLIAKANIGGKVFLVSRAVRVGVRGEVVVHRVAKVLATLPGQRRNLEHRTGPLESLDESGDAHFALVFRHHV